MWWKGGDVIWYSSTATNTAPSRQDLYADWSLGRLGEAPRMSSILYSSLKCSSFSRINASQAPQAFLLIVQSTEVTVLVNFMQLCSYFMGTGFANLLTEPWPASPRYPPQFPASLRGGWSPPGSLKTSVVSKSDAGERSGRTECLAGSLVSGELKGVFRPFGISKIPNTF